VDIQKTPVVLRTNGKHAAGDGKSLQSYSTPRPFEERAEADQVQQGWNCEPRIQVGLSKVGQKVGLLVDLRTRKPQLEITTNQL
jgi:hypothetical protein